MDSLSFSFSLVQYDNDVEYENFVQASFAADTLQQGKAIEHRPGNRARAAARRKARPAEAEWGRPRRDP